MKLHHIGIVVCDDRKALEEISQFFTFNKVSSPELVVSQNVDIRLLQLGDFFIELVKPNSLNSPIYDFSLKGGGFHHICLEVDDTEKKFEEMVKKGAKPIVEPVIGFEDRLTAFLYLPNRAINCNLIELAEKKVEK